VFDIGGPEFLVIAIVALVVLGPERLPEVMRRAGVFYRQARQMLNEYTSEAQRMFEEGMSQVNEVSDAINSTWQEATAETAANTPPPALLQLPPPLQAPENAANAGPWTLAAWYRDARADLEPQARSRPESPFALGVAHPERDELFDDLGIGGASSMGPAPEDRPGMADEPGALPPTALPDDGRVTRPADVAPAREPGRRAAALPRPAFDVADEGRLFAEEDQAAPTSGNGKLHGTDEAKDPGAIRQETLIELYRTGDVTLEKAAEFLGISPAQFRGLLKRK
jgi:Tat protein translocase TatB subunit